MLGVEALDEGRYRIAAERDVRELVARAAVDDGLLEHGAHRALEDVFLQLTRGGHAA